MKTSRRAPGAGSATPAGAGESMVELTCSCPGPDGIGRPAPDVLCPRHGATQPEPPPVVNDQPAIHDLVAADLAERKRQGIAKYGTALQAFNGRRPLVDAYQESLDQAQYLKQATIEWDAMTARIAALERLLLDGVVHTAGLPTERYGITAWRRHAQEVMATPLADHVARHGRPTIAPRKPAIIEQALILVRDGGMPLDDAVDVARLQAPEVEALMGEGYSLTEAVQAILTRRERHAAVAAVGEVAPAAHSWLRSSKESMAAVEDPAQRQRMASADVGAWQRAHPPGGPDDAEVPCRYCGEGMSQHTAPDANANGARHCKSPPTVCPVCYELVGDHVRTSDGRACHLRGGGARGEPHYQPNPAAVFTDPPDAQVVRGPAGPIEVELKLALAQFGKVPEYKSEQAAGMDVCAAIGVARTIAVGQRWRMKLGLHLEIPPGFYATVEGRSGLFDEHGIVIHSGIIDPDYRGEIAALMMNEGDKPVEIQPGQRIAQLVLHRRVHATAKVVAREDLSDTVRGARGFGSSGKF